LEKEGVKDSVLLLGDGNLKNKFFPEISGLKDSIYGNY